MTCGSEMDFFHSDFMLRTHEDQSSILPSCTPQEFQVVASLLGKRPSMSFSTGFDMCEDGNNHGEDELSDEGSQLGEKKRRLNLEQVKTLEKNFEQGNKLEPERKMQLARALGLQPRQVAIWFQNRRARWKTKTLEKDYEILKRQFEAVKAENEALVEHNQKLHSELVALKTREPTESINLNKETEGSSSNNNRSTDNENSSEIIKLEISTNKTPAIDSPLPNRPLFSSSLIRPHHPSGESQQQHIFQSLSSRQSDQTIKEENLCNMFVGMDDQSGFWPWLDHQSFH